jgi:uncharacterized protein
MELTIKDRLIIANQLRILEALYPKEAADIARHRTAIERGYQLHYDWLVNSFEKELSEEQCREILEILDMYRALKFSYKELKDKRDINEEDLRFPGFDGNNEPAELGYVNYFVIDLERFNELRDTRALPVFNSHMPMLERYRRMLAIWKQDPMPGRFKLSRDRILAILGA